MFVQNLPVTRIVEQLLEAKSSKVTDDYRYLDPKMLRVTDRYIPRQYKHLIKNLAASYGCVGLIFIFTSQLCYSKE